MDVNDGHTSGPPGQGHALTDAGGDAANRVPVGLEGVEERPVHPRLMAMIVAGRYHGQELDPNEFRSAPTATALSTWAQSAGMWARAVRLC